MNNSWRAPINGVGTYAIIRLWNKGDKQGSLLGMFLMLLGPIGCLMLLGFLIALIATNIAFILGFVAFCLFAYSFVWLFSDKSKYGYFYAHSSWWKYDRKTGHTEQQDLQYMLRTFTLEQRKAMQKKFYDILKDGKDHSKIQ